MKKKILIAIADAGNAHRIAAEAIEETFNNLYPDKFEFKIIDMLKEADVEPFNTSDISYSLVSKNTFLDRFNIGFTNFLNTNLAYGTFKNYTNNRLYKAFLEIINEFDPDIVICNHPMPAITLSEIKRNGARFKYVITMLDLVTFFRSMADENADLIFAPTRDTISNIASYGISLEKVIYPLFPLHPKLKNTKLKKETVKELGFDQNKPIVLLTGGGLGLRTLRSAIMQLAQRNDLQLIIVTGKLHYFKKELDQLFKDRKDIKVFGFVHNMQDYFRAADIVVSKPGATTIMECELFKKKAIFTKRVGHVEVGHDQYIKRNPRFRYIGNNWNELESTINELLLAEYNEVKDQTKRDYDECQQIVKKIVEECNFEF